MTGAFYAWKRFNHRTEKYPKRVFTRIKLLPASFREKRKHGSRCILHIRRDGERKNVGRATRDWDASDNIITNKGDTRI